MPSEGRADHRRATGDERQRRSSSGSGETRARGGDRRGKPRENDRMLTGSAGQSLDGSGKAWGRRIDGRGPAAGGGRRRRCGRCRARGGFGCCRDDQGDEAELMACSGRGAYGQGEGGDPGGGEEPRRGMDRGSSGELIPVVASVNRRPGRHAGAWPRRRRRRPPPAAYWREGGDERGRWAGPG